VWLLLEAELPKEEVGLSCEWVEPPCKWVWLPCEWEEPLTGVPLGVETELGQGDSVMDWLLSSNRKWAAGRRNTSQRYI